MRIMKNFKILVIGLFLTALMACNKDDDSLGDEYRDYVKGRWFIHIVEKGSPEDTSFSTRQYANVLDGSYFYVEGVTSPDEISYTIQGNEIKMTITGVTVSYDMQMLDGGNMRWDRTDIEDSEYWLWERL